MWKFQLVWWMDMWITIILKLFSLCHIKYFKMEQTAPIKFGVKLKKTATEKIDMLKSRTVKNVYQEQVCLNGIKGSKKGKSRYKTMTGKAVLQHPEQKYR
jgi:hypothetical protein